MSMTSMRISLLLLFASLLFSTACNQMKAAGNPSNYSCAPADSWGSTYWCNMIDHPAGQTAPTGGGTTTGTGTSP